MHSHNRIFRKQREDAFHFFTSCFLQTLTHHVHAKDKNRKASKQAKQNLQGIFHNHSHSFRFTVQTVFMMEHTFFLTAKYDNRLYFFLTADMMTVSYYIQVKSKLSRCKICVKYECVAGDACV